MIALPSSVRIYLAAGAVDLRKSIDGLGAIVMARACAVGPVERPDGSAGITIYYKGQLT
jgi:hypothetical protein